jgi:hypothetical protein
MGPARAAGFCAGRESYEAVLIRADATVISTPGIDLLRADD